MVFMVDNRILATSIWICDMSLSSVYIKNDRNFLWFILVPRVEQATEIFQLSIIQRNVLMEEIARLSAVISEYHMPDKLNVGALGNIVSQLHIHVVARFHNDEAWPHSVWQSSVTSLPYNDVALDSLVTYWRGFMELFC